MLARIGRRNTGYGVAVAFVCASAALAACTRHKQQDGLSAAADGVTSAAAAAPPPPVTAVASAPPPYGLGLADRLGREAQSRPTDTPRAEAVFAAIEKAGVPLGDVAQHLASPVGASFCVGAKSRDNVAVSACEYADEAAAVAGRDMSQKAFSMIEHRDVVVNKKTTLTILQSPFDATSRAAHDKALVAFKQL